MEFHFASNQMENCKYNHILLNKSRNNSKLFVVWANNILKVFSSPKSIVIASLKSKLGLI